MGNKAKPIAMPAFYLRDCRAGGIQFPLTCQIRRNNYKERRVLAAKVGESSPFSVAPTDMGETGVAGD